MKKYEDFIEKIAESKPFNENDKILFDELYILPRFELHDSGYHLLKIYGYNKNEDCFYYLTLRSDVIHFEHICEKSWFCSIDIPYFGVFRIFTRRNYKFLIPFTNISDFTIEFTDVCKENKDSCEVEKRGCEGCYYDK